MARHLSALAQGESCIARKQSKPGQNPASIAIALPRLCTKRRLDHDAPGFKRRDHRRAFAAAGRNGSAHLRPKLKPPHLGAGTAALETLLNQQAIIAFP
jgi:hypothetical protein